MKLRQSFDTELSDFIPMAMSARQKSVDLSEFNVFPHFCYFRHISQNGNGCFTMLLLTCSNVIMCVEVEEVFVILLRNH